MGNIKSCRYLTECDASIIDAFLRSILAETYFIRSNIQTAGLRNEGKFLQADYYGAFSGGHLTDLISFTTSGALLVAGSQEGSFRDLCVFVKNELSRKREPIHAIIGLSQYTSILIEMLRIPDSSFVKNDKERLFVLDGPPRGEGVGQVLYKQEDLSPYMELIGKWFGDYNIEVKNFPSTEKTYQKSAEEAAFRAKTEDLFVLMDEGKPVSLCAISHNLDDMLYIAPVWTPHAFRNKGYGRRVCAQAIRNCLSGRSADVKTVLVTSNPIAEKLYRSLGFYPVTDWTFALLRA